MDRSTTRLIALGLALAGCTCGDDDFDLPEPEGVPAPAPEIAPRDPRLPPDFDLPVPEHGVVRYGESNADRANVLVTTDRPVAEVARWVEGAWTERGWSVSRRSMGPPDSELRVHPEVIDASDSGETVATAVIAREAADITRVQLIERLEGGRPFHAPEEPREWMEVERAPLPALPGREAAEMLERLGYVGADDDR